jgi:hypothetical protein
MMEAKMNEKDMTIEELHASHPALVSQIEARAREGMFTRAALETAVSTAKNGMIPLAEIEQRVSVATVDATASERTRIMSIHATCKGSKADTMFARLVADGCNEQQACDRIQDALAMQSDDQEIVSRISGSGRPAQKMPDAQSVYGKMNAGSTK